MYGGLSILAAPGEEPRDSNASRKHDLLAECHFPPSKCVCFSQDPLGPNGHCRHRFPHFVQWPEHNASADTLGESTALPLWGEAKGRNGEGKLINSFHLQHFPHSIIFKLNKLSLGERGKSSCSAQPWQVSQSPHCGVLMENESPWSPPLNAPFYTAVHRQPLRLPSVVETLDHRHVASVGLLLAPWSSGLGVGDEQAWVEQKGCQEKSKVQ